MKQLTRTFVTLVLCSLFVPLLLACAEDKATAPPPSTGASPAMDNDSGAATAAPAPHGGGW
ncbi:MAG: hypothetical protein M3O50_06750 [Myxococcota bacterium]|nr:hypothetical protein [Myxococcota bacterium]